MVIDFRSTFIHANVDVVLESKNVYEIEGVIKIRDSYVNILDRTFLSSKKCDIETKGAEINSN